MNYYIIGKHEGYNQLIFFGSAYIELPILRNSKKNQLMNELEKGVLYLKDDIVWLNSLMLIYTEENWKLEKYGNGVVQF